MKTKNIISILFCVSVLLIQTVTAQNFEWAKAIGEQNLYFDQALSITVDDSGNSYIAGFFYGEIDFGPGLETFNLTSQGEADIFVLKVDLSGDFQWTKSIGGIEEDIGNSITLDPSGNVFVTGYFEDTVDFHPDVGVFNLTSAGERDVYILKLNNDGDFISAIRFGGIDDDQAYDIAIDNLGNILTTGTFRDTVDFDPSSGVANYTEFGGIDIFISKLDASGNFLWAKQIGGSDTDQGSSLVLDALNNVYITGNFGDTADFYSGNLTYNVTSAGSRDVFILKLDTNGDFDWVKTLRGSGDDFSNAITLDTSENIYTTGSFEDTVDFDPDSIDSYDITSNGGSDVFISKLDNDGNFLGAKSIGGIANDAGQNLSIDAANDLYIAGNFEGTTDLNPGPLTNNHTSHGLKDFFIVKLNNIGNFEWATSVGNTGNDFSKGMTTDSFGNVYSVGSFSGTVDFDPGAETYFLNSGSQTDGYIQKINGSKTLGVSTIFKESLTTYPNPTSEKLTINLGEFYNDITLNVRTITGQLITTKKYTSKNTIDFNIEGSAGLYFAEILADTKKAALKIIKQ